MSPLVTSLAYAGFTSPAAEAWRTFGPDRLGLELVDDGPDGTVRLRNDDAAWRLAVRPGQSDDLDFLGWEVAGPAGLDRAAETIEAAGCPVHRGDVALAATRGVDDIAWFIDPVGFRHELIPALPTGTPFTPGRPDVSFVTGPGGLGHAVLIVPDLDEATAFYVGVLGFGHSDDIDMGLLVRFLHCNRRHHSLAMTAVPGHRGVHHLMLEVGDADQVVAAYDRVRAAGEPVAMDLGRHTNDEMFSFYVRTPSGFEIEYGSGGRLIDTTVPWPTGHYDAMSSWGHRPPAEPLFPGILRPMEVPA